MSKRRQRNDSPFTLFAFQDIITAVTGILILITLILALTLVDKPLEVSSEQKKDVGAMQAQVASLNSDLSRFQEQVDSDAVIINLMARHGASDAAQLIEILENAVADANELYSANADSIKSATSTSEVIAADIQEKQIDLEKLLNMIADDQALFEKLTETNRIFFRLKTNGVDEPWLIECQPNVWLAGSPFEPGSAVTFKQPSLSDRLASLEAWAGQLPQNQQYFVVIVKPGAVDSFRTIRASRQLTNVTFGTDLVATDVTIVDPALGASLK